MGLPEYMDSVNWQLAYWEHLARFGRRKRVWRSGWDHWALRLGDDEVGRRTLVIGPWVIALWNCRCGDCKFDERMLLDIVDNPPRDPDDIVGHVNQTVAATWTVDGTHYTTTGWHLASQCGGYPECPHHVPDDDDDFDEPLDDAIRNFAG